MEFDDEKRPQVVIDYNGKIAFKVQAWQAGMVGLGPEAARLATMCLHPGRPWVQVTVDSLAPGSFHRFKVVAVNACGDSQTGLVGPVAKMLPGMCACVDSPSTQVPVFDV